MAVDFRERDISEIKNQINAFWSEGIFNDQHIIDQLWRGYYHTFDNFYTQLYQLHYAKCVETIPHQWLSHWEKYKFTESNKVDAWNPLYPYAYTLPKNSKNVYLLRESPRDISILPKGTLVTEGEEVLLPSGEARKGKDTVFGTEALTKYEVEDPIGGGIARGIYAEEGLPVATVMYFKRGDQYNDYDEGVTPLGDFIVDEDKGYIAFRREPYSVLWSEYTVRDTEVIYDNFGSLIQFYKPDSYQYLKQIQALWFAFWNGSSVRNIEIGLNVLKDLPVAGESGFVESVVFLKEAKGVTITVDQNLLSTREYDLRSAPELLDPNTGNPNHDITISSPNHPQYMFKEGIDYEIITEWEDAHDYDAWESWLTWEAVNEVPSVEKRTYIKFNQTTAFYNLIDGDTLLISYQDGSGDYVVSISGKDYVITDDFLPYITVGQYIDRYTPLTNAIRVYDYKNWPDWWKYLIAGHNIFGESTSSARLVFDSGFPLDGD